MGEELNTISTELTTNTYDFMNNLFLNPILLIVLLVVVILYLSIFLSLGDTTNQTLTTDNSSSSILTILIFVVLLIIIIVNGLQYLFSIDIIAKIKNLFSQNPQIDIIVDNNKTDIMHDDTNKDDIDILKLDKPKPLSLTHNILLKKQVFNIPENSYNYSDAKAICKAYGARLADYSEIEEAYKSGGEWCNYGWSKNQMILFPTQEETWNKLQKKKGHENDCGRPGINGGYIANPNLKYGVNCYGYKPKMSQVEEELMATMPVYPKTKKDIEMENRVKYWKGKLNDIIVSPFNHSSWSKI